MMMMMADLYVAFR